MTAASTAAARAILQAESATADTTTGPDPTPPDPTPAEPTPATPATGAPPSAAPAPPSSDALAVLMPVLRHGLDVLVADMATLAAHWGR